MPLLLEAEAGVDAKRILMEKKKKKKSAALGG
jgi:hypothetical protein